MQDPQDPVTPLGLWLTWFFWKLCRDPFSLTQEEQCVCENLAVWSRICPWKLRWNSAAFRWFFRSAEACKTKTSHDSKICLLDSKCGKCSRFWTPDSFLLDLYTYQKFQFLVRAILLDLIKKLLQHSRCHFWERSVQEKKLTSWRHKIKCRGQFYILFCLERKK